MARIDDALRIRDLALRIIKAQGVWGEINAWHVLMAERGPFSFLHTTPFQREFQQYVDQEYARLGRMAARPLPYRLNIWFQHKKVLLLEWDGRGRTTLVSFRRGNWETDPVLTNPNLE